MTAPSITLKELSRLRDCGQRLDIIDVRTPSEFSALRADIATNIPLHQLDPRAVVDSRAGGEPLYLICQSGTRALMACEKFIAAGFANVVCVEGGTAAWESAGLPVVRGKKSLTVEQQVRISMGTLVLLGVILGLLVHPGFLGLSAFVGCGLVYAGITGRCGMATLFSKMPWNNRACEGQGCCAHL
jgi:rhodanese-related sulfurtransferase